MMGKDNDPVQIYRNKVRVRVSGILVENNKILMVNHKGLSPNNMFWSPPGGGIEYSENAEKSLHREFKEETGLKVQVGHFLFVNEVILNNLHAIEIFFEVSRISGEIMTGTDPEQTPDNQIIKNVVFLSLEDIRKVPEKSIHNCFHNLRKIHEIFNIRGYSYFSGVQKK